jgi:D-glycero-D-manno-heptose 1,7-bisphosphate phosphatase
MSRRALFIDRDGVINDLVYYPSHEEWEGPRRIEDLRLIPGIETPLLAAQKNGWQLFLVTNQPSDAKGKTSLEALREVHASVLRQLASKGVTITEAYVCYHHPTSKIPGFGPCDCRKPSDLFLRQAAKEHDIDLGASWVVGDQDTDIEMGRRAGSRTASIANAHSSNKRGKVRADREAADLADFVSHLTG